MSNQRDFDGKSEMRDVIAALLALVLSPGIARLDPTLTDMVSACKGVVEHQGKRWASYPRVKGISSLPASASSLTR